MGQFPLWRAFMAQSILRYIIRLAILFSGIAVASLVIPGIEVLDPWSAIKAAMLLSALNVLIKPLIVLLTLPITLISLGFFLIVINGFMLWLVGYAIDGFDVSGIPASIMGSIVISIINMLLYRFV